MSKFIYCKQEEKCNFTPAFCRSGNCWKYEPIETPTSDSPVDSLVIWHEPDEDKQPSETMLVAVQTNKGFDTALVYVDDDGTTLIDPEYHDVWTAWSWEDVTKYALLSELLAAI